MNRPSIPAAIASVLPERVDALRVVVTGSREWSSRSLIHAALWAAFARSVGQPRLAHGGATGADEIAGAMGLVAARDLRGGLTVEVYPANWDLDGRAAGPLRNQRMIEAERPHLVLAFPLPRSRGTWDCVRRARAMGVPVVVVREDGTGEVVR